MSDQEQQGNGARQGASPWPEEDARGGAPSEGNVHSDVPSDRSARNGTASEGASGGAWPEGAAKGAPVPPPSAPRESSSPFSDPYVPPAGQQVHGQEQQRGQDAQDSRRPSVGTSLSWQQPDGGGQSPLPTGQQSSGLFGPNGRWLWFAGGVLLGLIGVVLALLFNMGKPAANRNDAVKFAAWGMLAGFVLEVVTLYMMGGAGLLYSMLGIGGSPSGGGSVF